MTDDQLREALALATASHYLDPHWTDADNHHRCICGGWAEGEMEPGWDDHMAEVALDAIRASGRLLPDGGKTRTEWGAMRKSDGMVWSRNDRADALRSTIRDERHGVVGVERTVTTWPNGDMWTTPWTEVS